MIKLILTCEHGGNKVPAPYQPLFENHQELLASHEGYDIGALELFQQLEGLAQKSFSAETTRLLIELNRSLHHKKLFSVVTQPLPKEDKQLIIKTYYSPYREQVENLIHDFVMAGRTVLHIAVHTFTPVLKGEERDAAIGLLYDPQRKPEQAFCRDWKNALNQQAPDLLVRFNYPYLGIADGFPTYLRHKFSASEYIGIELEVNQKFALEAGTAWLELQQVIRKSLEQVLQSDSRYQTSDAI
ncbi:N-formylglutamate amidohydrolase [Pontibacter sp. CAU 1760]